MCIRDSYYSWPAGPKLKGVPTIQLKTVNDGNPNPSAHDYPGWVVTAFDAWYGKGIIRVVKAKPAIAATLTG